MIKNEPCNGGVILRGVAALGVVAVLSLGSLDLQAQGNSGDVWSGHAAVPGPAADGKVRPHVWIRDGFIGLASAKPATRSGPSGFWPIDMQTAYGINGISGLPKFSTVVNGTTVGTLTGGGAGITIALVDAYDGPNALADLNAFSSTFGLPTFSPASPTPGQVCTPKFSKVGQTGSTTSLPAYNSGWEVEINLDTQWVHSIAPCANILLVEANSSYNTDLLAAVQYAGLHAQAVSMSWGGGEFRGESNDDTYFQAPNVVFLASSGDTGGVVEWPSVSNSVVAVGGTNLPVSSSGGLGTGAETAWSGSGGGCSSQKETEPSVETVIKYPSACSFRGVPDVAASAGPNSAVAVLISKQGGWYQVYGTSLASPMWAAMIGIADGLSGNSTLYLSNSSLADVYLSYPTLYSTNYNDITSGSAGKEKAVTGWDFVTGLGSPKGNALIPYLATK